MPVACPSEKVGCTAYEPTGSSETMSTSRLPVCSTSWPGPWPRTSAEGEYTRRNSNGRRKTRPSEKVTSIARERWCSLISVGTRSDSTLLDDLVGDALEIRAALHELRQAHADGGFHEDLDDAVRLEPAHRQHQGGRRIERLHGGERHR